MLLSNLKQKQRNYLCTAFHFNTRPFKQLLCVCHYSVALVHTVHTLFRIFSHSPHFSLTFVRACTVAEASTSVISLGLKGYGTFHNCRFCSLVTDFKALEIMLMLCVF